MTDLQALGEAVEACCGDRLLATVQPGDDNIFAIIPYFSSPQIQVCNFFFTQLSHRYSGIGDENTVTCIGNNIPYAYEQY